MELNQDDIASGLAYMIARVSANMFSAIRMELSLSHNDRNELDGILRDFSPEDSKKLLEGLEPCFKQYMHEATNVMIAVISEAK